MIRILRFEADKSGAQWTSIYDPVFTIAGLTKEDVHTNNQELIDELVNFITMNLKDRKFFDEFVSTLTSTIEIDELEDYVHSLIANYDDELIPTFIIEN